MNPVTVIDDYLADLIAAPADGKAPAEPAAGAGPPPFKAVITPAGSEHISDDEFEALLDELHGPSGAPAGPLPAADAPAATATAPAAAASRDEIGDDEFEALLDELHGKGAPPTALAPAASAPVVAQMPVPAPAAPQAPPPAPVLAQAQATQVASSPFAMEAVGAGAQGAPDGHERRRRASDRVTTWLRFSLGEQHFAVEVLKVQEVLRVPEILPLRGAAKAMIGLMNLRGQIVPVLDLAMRLGLPKQVPTESSRVIVLEENGDTLGLLVRAVADVLAINDAAVEHLNGPLAVEGADVTCGIARRERGVTVLLDAKRLLG